MVPTLLSSRIFHYREGEEREKIWFESAVEYVFIKRVDTTWIPCRNAYSNLLFMGVEKHCFFMGSKCKWQYFDKNHKSFLIVWEMSVEYRHYRHCSHTDSGFKETTEGNLASLPPILEIKVSNHFTDVYAKIFYNTDFFHTFAAVR